MSDLWVTVVGVLGAGGLGFVGWSINRIVRQVDRIESHLRTVITGQLATSWRVANIEDWLAGKFDFRPPRADIMNGGDSD